MARKRIIGLLRTAVALALVTFWPHTANAELQGADRVFFMKSFVSGCESSGGTDKLIQSLAGTAAQKQAYCHCVANAYADRLSIETINRASDIERVAIADWSRRLCLTEVFPDKGPFDADLQDRRYYPDDAETVKGIFSWTTSARSTMSIDLEGSDRMVQLFVIDASKDLFCWSNPLSIEREILGSSQNSPRFATLWCEGMAGGYGEIYQVAKGKFMVGFALENGLKDWSVHEIDLEKK